MTPGAQRFLRIARLRWRQMRALVVKELRQLVRDRLLLGFVIYIFTLHIVVSTLGLSTDLRRAALLVQDGDRTPASRELVYGFRAPYFTVSGRTTSSRSLVRALDDGTARLALDVPGDFERTIVRGERPARVQLLVDASKVTLGFLASSYAVRRVERYSEERSAERLGRLGINVDALPTIENERRAWYNFSLDDQWPGSLSVLLMMMTLSCVMLPAAAALREREKGTIEQLLVSPLGPLEIMISKMVAMVLVTVLGSVLSVYLVLVPIFGVPMRGSAPLFFGAVALYAFTNAGLGLTLSTFARTSGQAGLLVILTVLPMIQLSGITSPVEGMPPLLRSAIRLSPLYHFIDIAFGIVFRGEGVRALLGPFASMCALGLGLFLLGLSRFRRQFSRS